MKKFFKRFCAYLVDVLVVSLIVYLFTSIPFVNFQLDDYNKSYEAYEKTYVDYIEFVSDLENYYEDNKLTRKEYDKLVKGANKDYIELLDEHYKDDELTKTGYSSLVKDLDRDFQKKYKNYYYNISKYSTIYNIIYIVVLLLYFVLGNIWFSGQTLGKKLLKLKIVSNDDSSKKVTWVNFLIRALVLYNPIYYLVILISPYLFNVNSFYSWALVFGNIKNYLEIIIMVMIVVRLDNRGLHELLSNTKVIYLDDVSSSLNVSYDNDYDIEKRSDNKGNVKKKNEKKIVVDEEE